MVTKLFTQLSNGCGLRCVRISIKFFFGLILKDRLSTRELLRRKNMVLQDYNCVLCSNAVQETLFHLLLGCPFAIQCWGLIDIQSNQLADPLQTLQSFKDQLQVPFFMEIIIIMAWTIWRSRNDLIFRQINPSLQLALQNFKDVLNLLLLRAKSSSLVSLEQRIANLS